MDSGRAGIAKEPVRLSENGEKSQFVRLADVFLFGPLMIMGALDKRPPKWMRLSLIAIGVGTIVYNLGNYLKNPD